MDHAQPNGGQPRYGLYTGIVHDNDDPEKAGRLRLLIPHVMGQEVHPVWAYMGGQHQGVRSGGVGAARRRGRGTFRVPPVGSQVLVQFLDGDVRAPVWMPGIWPRELVPSAAQARGYPERSVLARGDKLDVVEDTDGNIAVGTERDRMKVTLDTRGGDLEVTTSGLGGGVVKMQGGDSTQKAIRASDTVICGTLSIQVQPMTGIVIGVTYTPPPSTGQPPVVMSLATGIFTAPIVGAHQGGAPKVLIGD